MDNKKAIFGWAMYDWANSAFATTVMAGFFPIFFERYWSGGVEGSVNIARVGLANSIGGITIAVLAPILGAIADNGSSKRKFLIFFAYMGAIMTSALYMVSRGNWILAILLYIFANIGFAGANIFYDALLIGVASEKKMDFVSALGYSMGYLGGGILFAVNVWMTLCPETFGFANETEAVKVSFLMVGAWWVIFTVPLLIFVKESANPKATTGINMVKAGLLQLKDTFARIRQSKTIFLFLLAYWLYIDGVDTVVRMAVIYGKSIGLATNDLIGALLLVQFVGFPAAIGFGFLSNKISAKRSIFIAIGVYLFVCVWAAFIRGARDFYIMAVIIALVQGGIQALSRSYYAKIIPADRSAEYFGFYNMLGKFAVVIGPALVGAVALLLKYIGASENIATRTSIVSIAILFLAGGTVFYFVNKE